MKWFRLLLVCPLIVIALSVSVFAQQSGYYTDDGSGALNFVPAADPDVVRPEEWQVRLYRANESATGRDYWGVITGRSAAQVMARLAVAQRIQQTEALFFGRDYRQVRLTYFNYVGPIAVFRRASDDPHAIERDQMARRFYDLEAFAEVASSIRSILDRNPRERTPFDGMGTSISEYASVLSQAQEQLTRLMRLLDRNTSTGVRSLERQIDQAMNDLNRSHERLTQATGPLIAALDQAMTLGGSTSASYSIRFNFRISTAETQYLQYQDTRSLHRNEDGVIFRIHGLMQIHDLDPNTRSWTSRPSERYDLTFRFQAETLARSETTIETDGNSFTVLIYSPDGAMGPGITCPDGRGGEEHCSTFGPGVGVVRATSLVTEGRRRHFVRIAFGTRDSAQEFVQAIRSLTSQSQASPTIGRFEELRRCRIAVRNFYGLILRRPPTPTELERDSIRMLESGAGQPGRALEYSAGFFLTPEGEREVARLLRQELRYEPTQSQIIAISRWFSRYDFTAPQDPLATFRNWLRDSSGR